MNIRDLKFLEEKSLKRNIPILGSEKGSWLLKKIQELRPEKILELGTANGYSGCILGSEGAEIITIEKDPKIAEEANKNFSQYNINAFIVLGDGVDIVDDLNNKKKNYYDLIFIDFAKKKYIKVLENCISMVKKGGLIIADNISMKGCANFKEAVLKDNRLKTEIVSIKDGLSVSIKK